MKTYTPQPLDTSRVQLSEELIIATEDLSKHVHDVWARQRIIDGWTYGPKRNDDLKKHPCLIPYDELTEDEKAYDRNTAIGTIEALVVLGIVKI